MGHRVGLDMMVKRIILRVLGIKPQSYVIASHFTVPSWLIKKLASCLWCFLGMHWISLMWTPEPLGLVVERKVLPL